MTLHSSVVGWRANEDSWRTECYPVTPFDFDAANLLAIGVHDQETDNVYDLTHETVYGHADDFRMAMEEERKGSMSPRATPQFAP